MQWLAQSEARANFKWRDSGTCKNNNCWWPFTCRYKSIITYTEICESSLQAGQDKYYWERAHELGILWVVPLRLVAYTDRWRWFYIWECADLNDAHL
jgi:hypothetical protein